MAGHHAGLAGAGTHLTHHAVGIFDGDVQEIALAGGLVMGDGAFHHMAQVVELVAELLVLHPAAVAGPMMGMLGIHRSGGVQVTIGLLRRGHYRENAVDIGFQLLVRIGLEHIGSALDGLVNVGVVEGIAFHFEAQVHRGMHLLRRFHEILVAAFAFALGEGERNGDFTGSFQALAPEGILRQFYAGKGNRINGISTFCRACRGR